MAPIRQVQVGQRRVQITQFGMGGTGLGNIYHAVAEQDAMATVAAAYDAGVRYFDTAPLYGSGLSEVRLGRAIAAYPRDEIVISTKVGWSLVAAEQPVESLFEDAMPFKAVMDYSRDAVLRSFAESLARLATDRIDIVLMHDPDESVSVDPSRDPYEVSHFRQAMDEAYPVLDDLRAQGVIQAIGLGMNQWQMLVDFARAGDFDCFLLAGRYTLLEQEAVHQLLPLCAEKQISIIIGGPYNSGILATGAVPGATYNYAPAPQPVLARTRQIQAVCERHGVSLQAAALQFPFGHPAVAATIPGARSAAELAANVAFFQEQIPADFWSELRELGLIDPAAPLPAGR